MRHEFVTKCRHTDLSKNVSTKHPIPCRWTCSLSSSLAARLCDLEDRPPLIKNGGTQKKKKVGGLKKKEGGGRDKTDDGMSDEDAWFASSLWVRVPKSLRRDRLPHRHSHHIHTTLTPHHFHLHYFHSHRIHSHCIHS